MLHISCTLPSVHAHCRNRLFPCWHTSCIPWSVDFWRRAVTPFYPAITQRYQICTSCTYSFSIIDNRQSKHLIKKNLSLNIVWSSQIPANGVDQLYVNCLYNRPVEPYLEASNGEEDVFLRNLEPCTDDGLQVGFISVLAKASHFSCTSHLYTKQYIRSL